MRWFRLYSEARTDAKLESLSDAEHRVWFRLMCFAGDQAERGAIVGYDEELLAVEVARGDVELLRATLARLVKLRIVCIGDDPDTLRITNWDKRQYDKPSDTPDATRDRKRRSRQRHADVTPSHATETDTEADTETEERETGVRADARAAPEPSPHDLVEVVLEELGKTSDDLSPAWISAAHGHARHILEQGFGVERFRRYLAYRRLQGRSMDLRWIRQDILQWEADGEPESLPVPMPRGSPVRALRDPNMDGIRAVADAMRAREAGRT